MIRRGGGQAEQAAIFESVLSDFEELRRHFRVSVTAKAGGLHACNANRPGVAHWRRPDPPRRKFFPRLQFASERFLRAPDALPKSVKILPKISIHFPESRFISALRPNEGKKIVALPVCNSPEGIGSMGSTPVGGGLALSFPPHRGRCSLRLGLAPHPDQAKGWRLCRAVLHGRAPALRSCGVGNASLFRAYPSVPLFRGATAVRRRSSARRHPAIVRT